MAHRTASLPPSLGDAVNPFWSERLQAELELRKKRPNELPPVPGGEDDPDLAKESENEGIPVEDGTSSRARRPRSREPAPMRFSTPASWSSGQKEVDRSGLKTQGEMPVDPQAMDQEETDGLQRELEKEVVQQLHVENQRLRMEIEKLQSGRKSQETPSSWSAVTPEIGPAPPRSRSPMRRQDGEKNGLRVTPGGTQVPEGRPPDDEPSAPPALPEWPAFLRDYEVCSGVGPCAGMMGPSMVGLPGGPRRSSPHDQVCRGGADPRQLYDKDYGGGVYPRGLQDQECGRGARSRYEEGLVQDRVEKEMESMSLKAKWLEEELASFKRALESEPQSSRYWNDGYWCAPVHRHGSRDHQESRDDRVPGNHQVRHDDRAQGTHREVQGVRALQAKPLSRAHGGEVQGARAWQQQPRGRALGGEVQGASLSRAFGGDDCGDRAVHEHLRDGGEGCEGVADESNHGLQGLRQQLDGRDLCDPRDKFSGGLPTVQPGESRERSPQDALRSTNPVIPSLPPVNKKNSSIEAADWLVEVKPLIGDISNKASRWWELTMDRTVEVYQAWLQSNPLQRLRIQPPDPVSHQGLGSEQVIQRLEQRVTTILLPSLPLELRNDLVTSRQLWPCAILYKILRSYQPGGWAERSSLLMDLTTTKVAKDPSSAAAALRLWHRQKQRAVELGASIPDALLQIRALETIVSRAVARHPQSLFRISTFRMETGLDEQPNDTSIAQFLELLTAEMDAAALGTSMSEEQQQTSTKAMSLEADGGGAQDPTAKVKAIKPLNGKGQGSGGGKCRNWGTEQGCRYTKQCRFDHPVLPDASSRCWLCSSTLHRKNECPYKSSSQLLNGSTGGSGEQGGEKGKGKSKAKDKGGGKSKDDGGVVSPATMGEDSQGKPVAKTTAGGQEKDEEKPGVRASMAEQAASQQSEAADGLMNEVTSLLKSLRMQPPQLRAYNLRRLGDKGTLMRTLLDGGATHCLRVARNEKEWNEAISVNVQLASGNVEMRMNPTSKTLIVEAAHGELQPIIPLNKLAELGYEIKWTKEGCSMVHAVKGQLEVCLEQGCPTVPAKVGESLMKEIEEVEMTKAALRMVMWGRKEASTPEQRDALELRQLFPEVPDRILEKIPGKHEWSGAELPFNRRRRRQIELAKTIIVHLFAGKEDPRWKQQEKDGVVVVCLDILGGQDLLNNGSLAGWIEELARSGKVKLWLAGPPCRTVSALRNDQDGGPPVLRGRTEERFGLSTLLPRQQDYVDGDTTLWLRTLWWMLLAKRSGSEAEYMNEQPLDPGSGWQKKGNLNMVVHPLCVGKSHEECLRKWVFS